MAKKSKIQIAIDKIDSEIRELTLVRERLVDAVEDKPVRKPKGRKPRETAAGESI